MRIVLTGLRTRWWRAIEHYPQALILGALLLSAPLVLWLTWEQSVRWERTLIQAALVQADQALNLRQQRAMGDLDIAISYFKDLPELLAAEPKLTHVLEHPADAAGARAANRYLKSITRYLQVDLAWLVNARGLTVASNNYDTPESLVGHVFTDRLYYTEAMAGRPGHQFAVGRSSNEPGLFFSFPMRDGAGRILGLVVVKTNLSKVAQHIRTSGIFVTDEQGVVILSEQKELLFKAVPDAPVFKADADTRRKRYRRDDFPVLSLVATDASRYPGIELLGEQRTPVLHRVQALPEYGLTLHLVEEFGQLASWRAQQVAQFWMSSLAALAALWALVATLVFALRARLYRKNLEAANAELVLLNDRFKHQAETDFLTGCMNRRRFDQELAQEIRRSQRQKYPLTLALFDLDHFKRINDSYGHLVGDLALQHFADVMRAHLRQTDRFARLGGEEFALLMPDTGSTAAMPLIERLRQLIGAAPVALEAGAPLTITASIGVASLCPQDDHDSLYQRADDVMYEAKASGRNLAIFASCPDGQQEIAASV